MASHRRFFRPGRWGALLALFGPVLAGCHLLDKCGTCVDGHKLPATYPPPPGEYVRTIFESQAELAEEDDFVIYEHEWVGDTAALAPFGTYHLDQIAGRFGEVPFPVLIQIHPDLALNQARRDFVINYLTTIGYTDAPERVVVGFPKAEGLPGEQAVPIYYQYITSQYQSGYGFTGGYGRGSYGGLYGNRLGGGLGYGGLGTAGLAGGFGEVGLGY